MNSKKFFNGVLYVLAVVAATGCLEQDQTIVQKKPEHLEIANPKPTERDFVAINNNHKVLVAIFDTGIDYNHPSLVNNVHFDLDTQGKPVGIGYDYYGMDEWSSYRVVDTSYYEFNLLSKEAQDEILQSNTAELYDKSILKRRSQMECEQRELLAIDPRLQNFTQPYRGLMQEDYTTLHGTHVAGLMTYDRPDIGLISYRVLPYFQNLADRKNANTGQNDKFVLNFKDALERMSKVKDSLGRGVRVVNLSLGGSFERPDDDDPDTVEQFDRYVKIVTQEMGNIIKSYPNVLFVGAAGNDGGWSDNVTRIQYPCGIEAPNVLCVGATTNGRKTTYTNVPLNDMDLVFAPGHDLKSLSPADRCPFLRDFMSGVLNANGNGNLCKYVKESKTWVANTAAIENRREMVATLYKSCTDKENLYSKMSGTSMATPVITRVAAEILIERPELTPAQVIEEIKRRGKQVQTSTFKTAVLEQAKPSWVTPEDESAHMIASESRDPVVAGYRLPEPTVDELKLKLNLQRGSKLNFGLTIGRPSSK